MPYAQLSDVRLYYTLDGLENAPVLVFSNSLGTHGGMWAPQMESLAANYRILRYDTRGHGLSSSPDGEYTMTALAADVSELMDFLKIQQVDFCGLSMGGPTGLQFALDYPERVRKLILCNTAARVGTTAGWTERMAAVAAQGLEALAPSLISRWLSPAFCLRETTATRVLLDMMRRNDEAGYIGNCAALRDADLRGRLKEIAVPAMVIAGTQDCAATTEQGRELAQGISGACYQELDAAHLSNWEQPEKFNRILSDFLQVAA